MEDGKDTTHDDTIEDVPATARLLDGGENFTTVVRVESEKNNAVMPEMESADREEKREDRPEMSDILVGCSELGDIAVVSQNGFATSSEEEEEPIPDFELPTILKQISVNGSMLFPNDVAYARQISKLSAKSTQRRKTGLQGLSSTNKHTLGIVMIMFHCLTVVFAGQLAKGTYSKDFSAPFFLVYFRTVWRMAIFPAFMVMKWIYRRMRSKDNKPVSFTKTFTDAVSVMGPQGLTLRSFFYPCGFLSGLWMLVQFMHLLATKYLNNSIVQALFCAETAFSYTLSVLILKVPVFALKVMAVTVALGGIGLMAYSQSQGNNLHWEGVVICLAGAVLSSVYMVALKKMIGKSEDVGKALLLSTVMAVFVTLFFWPIVLILYYSGIEYWNADTFPWGIICASSGLSILSVSIFNLCLTLTSPLLMTLSKLLGIPVNYVIDWMFWDHQFDGYQIAGVILIGYGFVFIALPERWIALKAWAKCVRRQRSTPVKEVPPSESTAGPV